MDIESTETSSGSDSFPDWSNLLPPLVGRIYTFLDRKDQCTMALVCRSWSKEYNSPSVWGRMKFIISTSKDPMLLCSAVEMALWHNKMVHHIEIFCGDIEHTCAYGIWFNLREYLLRTISLEPQLQSFSLTNLKEFVWIFKEREDRAVAKGDLSEFQELTYQSIFRILVEFLCHQTKIKSFEFIHCNFSLEQALIVLSMLSPRSRSNEISLTIRRFVGGSEAEKLQELTTKRFLPIYFLIYLKQLDIDYEWLFVALVKGPQQCLQNAPQNSSKPDRTVVRMLRPKCEVGSLCRIKLYCVLPLQEEYPRISKVEWSCFVDKCPNMFIDLKLTVLPICEEAWEVVLAKVLVRNMPVRSLRFAARADSPKAFHTLFRRLIACRMNKCLETVVINWPCIPESLDFDFSGFLRSCSNLEKFCIYINSQNYKDCAIPSHLEDKQRGLLIVDTVGKAKEATAFLRTLQNSSSSSEAIASEAIEPAFISYEHLMNDLQIK